MRKIILFTFATVLMFTFTSCSKGGMDADPTTAPTTTQNSDYYFSYKANGVAVTATEFTAVRGTAASPRTLTITGTGKGTTNPKFKYFVTESFIGFVPGLTTESSLNSTGSHEVEYTNSNGLLHSTKLAKEKMTMFFTELSYTNGGVAKATFDGTIKAADGSIVVITEGKFKVKIGN